MLQDQEEILELTSQFHPDKLMLKKLLNLNSSISLLIQFINQLMFNSKMKETDTIMEETKQLSEANGVLSQLKPGSTALEVIPEQTSQCHLDKLMLKRDKKNKNSILPSTQLSVVLKKATQPNILQLLNMA